MRVLVTGAGGMVGREVVEALTHHEVAALDHAALDVADRDAVLAAVGASAPQAIVHCAAWTAVDACESDPDRARAVNTIGCRNVMEAARRAGAYVVALSTDYVFDGTKLHPYVEWDPTNPLSVYGRTKRDGEQEIDPECAVVRTSWVCGRYGANMLKTVLRLASDETATLRFVDDQRGCPTFAQDLASMLAAFVVERLPGIWHVTNQGPVTWFEFTQEVLKATGRDPARVEPITTADMPRPAPRPANSVLDNAALRLSGRDLLPDWRDALERTLRVL
ncbi:MAG TPA: dTDP-4-dehydrorhamnose reductase [Acidimicrobiia bacterium]|nr:dTDP-4-dehydrorhamnose reductase [Acidimicrobiia bacterium]